MNIFIGVVVGFIGGVTVMFFFLRNNPKWLKVDAIVKSLGKDKLAELKAKVNDLTK